MKKLQKLLALLLVLCLCAGTLPGAAFAETPEDHVHEFTAEVTEPSCTSRGYTVYRCACGEELTGDFVDPLPHESVDVDEIPAEVGKPGVTAGRVCSVCGEVLEGCEPIDALPAPEAEDEPEKSPASGDGESSVRTYGENVIVGVDASAVSDTVETEYKLILDVLRGYFPETLTVSLGGEVTYEKTEEGALRILEVKPAAEETLEVVWVCAEDYDAGLGPFHFSPEFAERESAEGLALPVITVVIEKEFEIPPLSELPPLPGRSFNDVSIKGRSLLRSDPLPAYHNSEAEGKLPPVRDQGQFGTCWTFSMLGAMEADLIHDDCAQADEIDLSELHLAYFTYHDSYDEKDCHSKDHVVINEGGDYLDDGGGQGVAYMYLANLIGPQTEENVPYALGRDYQPSADVGRVDAGFMLAGAYNLPWNDPDAIKQAILDHGGVAASYFMDQKIFSSTNNSYFSTVNSANHAIMLVGWDDAFPKEKFNPVDGVAPKNNGAWLVRNSWGGSGDTLYGMTGYFWISYEDVSLQTSWVVVADAEPEQYAHVYSYAGGPFTSAYHKENSATAQIDYNVDGCERLEAVGLELNNTGVSVAITVTDGVSTATASKSNCDNGFHMLRLSSPIELQAASTVHVTVEYSANGSFNVPVEHVGSLLYGKISFVGACDSGGFVLDGTTVPYDPVVRLYTSDLPGGAVITEIYPAIAATCGTSGFTAGLRTTSGKIYRGFGDWSVGDTLTEKDMASLKQVSGLSALVIAPTGEHSWGDWTTVTPASVTRPGERTRSCTVCEAVETESLPCPGSVACGFCGAEDGGENLSWTLSESGLLRISGTGAMADYAAPVPAQTSMLQLSGGPTAAPWAPYSEQISAVAIDSGVTRIGANAFSGCEAVTNVAFLGNMPKIGEGAFTGVNATATYPTEAEGYDEGTMSGYGGALNWVGETSHNVVLRSSGNGSTDGASVATLSGGGAYGFNASVTVKAPVVSGYRFVGWFAPGGTEALSTLAEYSFTMPNEDVSLVAVYTLTVASFQLKVNGTKFTVTGSSAVQSGSYSGSYAAGSEITLRFIGYSEESFQYWANASGKIVSTSKDYSFLLINSTTLEAVTADASASGSSAKVVFLSAEPDENPQILSQGTFGVDDTITFPTPPSRLGKNFTRWSMTEGEIKAALATSSYIEVYPLYEASGDTYSVTLQVRRSDGELLYSTVKGPFELGNGRSFKTSAVFTYKEEQLDFAYWTDADGTILGYDPAKITVRPTRDIVLIAVYGAAATPAPVTVVTDAYASESGDSKIINFRISRSGPAGYTLVHAGVVYAPVSSVGTDPAELKQSLVIGGGEAVMELQFTDTTLTEAPNFYIKVAAPARQYIVRGYMVVKDSSNNVLYIYSDNALYASYEDLEAGNCGRVTGLNK